MRNFCRTLTISICTALFTAGTLTFADADARSISYDLNIPSEDLTAALQSFAIASHHKLLYKAELTAGKISRALKGHFTAQEAIEALLSGTGLTFEITGSAVVLIKSRSDRRTTDLHEQSAPSDAYSQSTDGQPTRLKQANPPGGSSGSTSAVSSQNTNPSDSKSEPSPKEGLSEIVVTGTHIRGEENSISPIRTLDRTQIDASGVTTLEDLFRSVPENVGGIGVDTRRAAVTGQASSDNHGYASGINLRGLGSDATLVLLNGHRLPSASDGFSVDVSSIPLGIVDHVDILKDGASSIYGSDAVAGVVNIVTLNRFEGARTEIAGGTVTEGNKKDVRAGQLLGTSWATGSLFGVYTFNAQGDLDAADRPATVAATRPANSIPAVVSNQLFLSFDQGLGSAVDIHVEALGSERRFSAVQSGIADPTVIPVQVYTDNIHNKSDSLVTNASLLWKLPADWRLTLNGQYSATSTDYSDINSDHAYDVDHFFYFTGHNYGGDLIADGPLFTLPSGPVKLAVGVSHRTERYDGISNAPQSREIRAALAKWFCR